mgnify:CR=1 FL=1
MICSKKRKMILRAALLICTIAFTSIAFPALTGCSNENDNSGKDKLIVGATIIPLKSFIEAVTGDLAEIEVLVPPGSSPENYDPSPANIFALNKAAVFFGIDLPPEEKLDRSVFADTRFVDLADAVSDSYPDRFFDEDEHGNEYEVEDDGHAHSGKDPHIWMSPLRVIVMVGKIAEEMKAADPANSGTYEANASEFISKLIKLDEDISVMISALTRKKIIMFHPSLGYFADDYGLEMFALEDSGKEATAKNLAEMTDLARSEGITVIFAQAESAGTQAETFADEIGGRVEVIDPLSGDYIDNMLSIATKIAEAAYD